MRDGFDGPRQVDGGERRVGTSVADALGCSGLGGYIQEGLLIFCHDRVSIIPKGVTVVKALRNAELHR